MEKEQEFCFFFNMYTPCNFVVFLSIAPLQSTPSFSQTLLMTLLFAEI